MIFLFIAAVRVVPFRKVFLSVIKCKNLKLDYPEARHLKSCEKLLDDDDINKAKETMKTETREE